MGKSGADLPQFESHSEKLSSSTKCQWVWSLWFYNGAVTATVIVLAIVGSIHIQYVEDNCKIQDRPLSVNDTEGGEWELLTGGQSRMRRSTDENPDNDTISSTTRSQDVYINRKANKELYRATAGNILLIEFKKGLVSYYDENDDVCNIESELDPRLADVKQLDVLLDHLFTGGSFTVEHNEYEVGELVTDKKQFPNEVQWLCAGKDAYWLNKVKTDIEEQQSDDDGIASLSGCIEHCYPGPSYCCKRRWYGVCKQHCRDTVCSRFCSK